LKRKHKKKTEEQKKEKIKTKRKNNMWKPDGFTVMPSIRSIAA